MCALTAGQRGRKVLVLDHAQEIGRKILISGGGRCNFTNLNIRPECYLSQNPHFCRSALASYTQHDFIQLVKKHHISFHEKTLGQLFCDHSAKDILHLLTQECTKAQVHLETSFSIDNIRKDKNFVVSNHKKIFEAPKLVLATGGLSIPKLGSTDFTYRIAQQFGLALTEIKPALVPLTFGETEGLLMHTLAGISLEIIASCGKANFREAMVFTHRGLSGPAILQISSYWQGSNPISINLLPAHNAASFLMDRKKKRPRFSLRTALSELMPQRLAEAIEKRFDILVPLGEIPDKKIHQIGAFLKNWELLPTGHEGFAKAEVTLGGVDTRHLSSRTMESKTTPGLYVIGEALDVTGWLGGYNFQWAWSSGHAAGQSI